MSDPENKELRFLLPGVLAAPNAQTDVMDIAAYLGRNNPQIIPRFYAALAQSLNNLVTMPHLGAPRHFPHPNLHGLRQWPVKDFKNYLIFYRPFVSANGIEVLRILHVSRDAVAHLENP